MSPTVVCFGDSLTRGLISANYLDILSDRFAGQGFSFINAGVNNDHTLNLLRRARRVIALQPDYIIIMIGTNDIISTLSWRISLFNQVRKRLPERPSIDRASRNMTRLLRRLKAETHARVAVASIPVLGEDFNSPPMRHVRAYNRRLKGIAKREAVAYLPVFECMEAFLLEHGKQPPRAYHGSINLMFELMRARAFEREDFDDFSARKGFTLLTDGVHVNHLGAGLIADVFGEYLAAAVKEPNVKA